MTPTSSARLICLCGTIAEPGTLLADPDLPITSTEICHCNFCRYSTGSLGAAFPELSSSPSETNLANLTAYTPYGKVTDYFCSKCGCHCFAFNHRSKKWFCLGGIIEPLATSSNDTSKAAEWPKDVIKVQQHDFVLDTIDGGLVPFLLNLNGRVIATWGAAAEEDKLFDLPQETVLSLPAQAMKDVSKPKENDFLKAECHCGGISLRIKCANYPANTEVQGSVLADPTKYKAYICTCRSCRLSTGVSFMANALIPPENIFNGSDPSSPSPIVFGSQNSKPGLSLKHNWSSPGVCRSFCSICGATVSFWAARKPELVSVAVAILRAEEGSLARRWLEWEWGRVSGKQDCVDEELCQAWVRSGEVVERM